MPTPTPHYLSIDYEADAGLLVGRWQRLVMPFELHRGYARLLDAAAEHACRYWLIDTSQRMIGVDATDVQWMMDKFFPQLQPRLGRTTYLAYLMAPHQLAGMLTDRAMPTMDYFDGRPYDLARFTHEEQARAWLRQCASQDAQVA
ncbi:hypothetical protein [Hymenobacter sp. CRA2]|uniref:hypothetical protein n=1 Tax=Hymenobacter sp. CRA2 TaxID=1955620 RepID=UPI00098F96DD|nr:hypothetical protein [Hymenobacter sp. CRA2]OON67039.1 hypothetical protein B0919_19585 [Hymenobacter sp. CRA2]